MAVLEPGGATTYDRVRDWALDVGGWGTTCPVPAEIMDALLLDCLQTIHTRIWDHDKYKTKWSFTVATDEYYVDDGGGSPEITTNIFSPMFAVINKIQRRRDHKELFRAESYPKIPMVGLDTPVESDDDPARLEWFTWGDEFVVSPPSTQSETYDAFGYRILNRSIWTYSAPTTTWQLVDLPDAYIETYQKCVLGFLLTATNDHVGAEKWLRAAADELQSLTSLNSGNVVNRFAREDEPLRMGGTPTSKARVGVAPYYLPELVTP
jgi:hypothetical protein